MIIFAEQKIILTNVEPNINATSDELANIIVQRLGLMPRKKGSTEKMNKVLVELYERSKRAGKEKKPADALMSVEEMAYFAGISRQTMYDYIKRWIDLDLISKTSYINQSQKVIIGYKLSGNTLELAFEKAKVRIDNNLQYTLKYIQELQRTIKNEKISLKSKEKEEDSSKSREKEAD